MTALQTNEVSAAVTFTTKPRRISEIVELRRNIQRLGHLRNEEHLEEVLKLRRKKPSYREITPFAHAPHVAVRIDTRLNEVFSVSTVTPSYWYRDDNSLILASSSLQPLRLEMKGLRGGRELWWRAFTLEDGARIERCLGSWFEKSPDIIVISQVP